MCVCVWRRTFCCFTVNAVHCVYFLRFFHIHFFFIWERCSHHPKVQIHFRIERLRLCTLSLLSTNIEWWGIRRTTRARKVYVIMLFRFLRVYFAEKCNKIIKKYTLHDEEAAAEPSILKGDSMRAFFSFFIKQNANAKNHLRLSCCLVGISFFVFVTL